jgi:hypothetical protein
MTLAIHNASLALEKQSIRTIQWTFLGAAGITTVAGITLLFGKILSIITAGQYTTLHAAILTSPYIFPLVVGAVQILVAATLSLAAIIAIAAAVKCITASILDKPITWENWKLNRGPVRHSANF